jgi:hypothetical protein
MLILDIELTDESPTLEPFFRNWWARLWRQPLPPVGAETQTEERDRTAGLLLWGHGYTRGAWRRGKDDRSN